MPFVVLVIPPAGPVNVDGVVPKSQFNPLTLVPTVHVVPFTAFRPFNQPSVV